MYYVQINNMLQVIIKRKKRGSIKETDKFNLYSAYKVWHKMAVRQNRNLIFTYEQHYGNLLVKKKKKKKKGYVNIKKVFTSFFKKYLKLH